MLIPPVSDWTSLNPDCKQSVDGNPQGCCAAVHVQEAAEGSCSLEATAYPSAPVFRPTCQLSINPSTSSPDSQRSTVRDLEPQ